jgi:hypothetical protein
MQGWIRALSEEFYDIMNTILQSVIEPQNRPKSPCSLNRIGLMVLPISLHLVPQFLSGTRLFIDATPIPRIDGDPRSKNEESIPPEMNFWKRCSPYCFSLPSVGLCKIGNHNLAGSHPSHIVSYSEKSRGHSELRSPAGFI